uniref:NADH dehydrogenase subunit 2 n=1 Tax=Proschkinia sp. SZCZR1824 TaxID=2588390 RepID=A0A4Y5SFW3_9STRA|nr:NADH dehydrogenase subunit 2 [Proschkinia sp. SZCZR1824]
MTCYLMINDDLVGVSILSFYNSFVSDFFAFFAKFFICFFSAVYFLIISDFLKEQNLISFEYLILILFAVLGLLLMCSSNDLLLAYLSIEFSSLAFYVLASFKKTSSYSVESGIKYFIVGAVSSAFFLLGSSYLYGISGSINFTDFFRLYCCSHLDGGQFKLFEEDFSNFKSLAEYGYFLMLEFQSIFNSEFNFNSIAELGLTLILFSLFIKLSAAPFHLWSLDVYEGSPTSSTIFFAVISKLSVFILLIRLCYFGFEPLQEWWQFYCLAVGVFSVFVGAFGGIRQRKLKTLFAYSSVNHMGYVLIAIGSAAWIGIQMVLFYMVVYMISSLSVWSSFLFLRLKHKTESPKYNKELGDLALLHKSNNSIAFSLSLTMFSMAGMPPLIGFFTKFSLFLTAVLSHLYLVTLVAILFSVVSTFYYIRLIKVLYFENAIVGKLYYPVNSEKIVLLSFLVYLLVFLFVNPTLFYLYCHEIVLSMTV